MVPGPSQALEACRQDFLDKLDRRRVQPRKRIALVQVYTREIEDYAKPAVSINRHYCALYGITHFVFKRSLCRRRHPAWSKLLAVLQVMSLQRHDIVIYIDADACFVNHRIDVQHVIQALSIRNQSWTLAVPQDPPHGAEKFNTGMWVIKNTPAAKTALQIWFSEGMAPGNRQYLSQPFWEQSVFNKLMAGRHLALSGRVVQVPYCFFNTDFGLIRRCASSGETLTTFVEKNVVYVCHVLATPDELKVSFMRDLRDALNVVDIDAQLCSDRSEVYTPPSVG